MSIQGLWWAWESVSCDRGLSIGEPGDVSSRCQWCDGPAPSHRGDRSSASGSVSPALTQHSPENGQILHRVDNSGIDNRVKALIIVSCLWIREQQFWLNIERNWFWCRISFCFHDRVGIHNLWDLLETRIKKNWRLDAFYWQQKRFQTLWKQHFRGSLSKSNYVLTAMRHLTELSRLGVKCWELRRNTNVQWQVQSEENKRKVNTQSEHLMLKWHYSVRLNNIIREVTTSEERRSHNLVNCSVILWRMWN